VLKNKPIPVDKECSKCKQRLLLTEFEIDESANGKRADICKSCKEHESKPYGTCCESHFQDRMIANTFKQLGILLQQVDVIRINGYEIPRELTEKMFRITHLVGVRCRYDSCSKANVIGDQVQP